MNNMDFVILILVGVVGIILGGLINQLISTVTDKRQSELPSPHHEPLLSLRREPETGRLLVTVFGEETNTSNHLDKNKQEKTKQLILELNEWLDPSPVVSLETDSIPLDREEHNENEGVEEDLPSTSINPVTILVRALQADVQKSKLPPESIVTQINDILQADLKKASHIKDPIFLMESPGMGMVVMIGLNKYNSVDDVPDDDIRDIIHCAVKKWEQRAFSKKE